MARGWLTPNFPPEHKAYTRQLLIPATADFLSLVNGALLELCHPYNFEQDGEMTPQETADFFTSLWLTYTHNVNEPPDWETPDDVDGEPEQPWYEQLSDWIIQGFLAVTFTPLAALTYQATVPKLRVAIRTGNLGALFKVLINGVEVWSGDSYSPSTDLIDQVFDMTAETEPYTVRIEHQGVGDGHGLTEAKLEVIRGEAVADMVATILRAEPTGCGVQWSTDDGGTWNTIDLNACISTISDTVFNTDLANAIAQGKVAVPGQPGPDTPPETDFCKTYHVLLHANDRWLSPIPVADGYTVEITNVTGAWWDGDITSAIWYCGNGQRQILGTCSDTGAHTASTDPLNTTRHMSIVGNVASSWFDPHSLSTIPAGIPSSALYLQANDSQLYDNQGSLEFDITICNHAPVGWTQVWDFSSAAHSWYGADSNTTWNVFGGVHQFGSSQFFGLYSPNFTIAAAAHLVSIEIEYVSYGPRTIGTQWYDNTAGGIAAGGNYASGTTPHDIAYDLVVGHQYKWYLNCNNASGVTISKITVVGTGVNPFI